MADLLEADSETGPGADTGSLSRGTSEGDMAHEHLGTYLNNHLAGSAAALQLMEHLRDGQDDPAVAGTLAELREAVGDEVRILEDLIARLDVEESHPRQATAWLAGKMGEFKLWLDDPRGNALRLLEGLDGLAVALAGKHALWQALRAASQALPELQGLDYAGLIDRSDQQQREVQRLRLAAAELAFVKGTGG